MLYEVITGDKFTPEMEKRLGLYQQALDTIIEQELLVEEAARLGIEVSSQELVDSSYNFV